MSFIYHDQPKNYYTTIPQMPRVKLIIENVDASERLPSRAKANNVGSGRNTVLAESVIQPGFFTPVEVGPQLPPNPAHDVEFGQGEPVFRRPVYTPPVAAKPNGQP